MPAERTRGSRRTNADGNQLVWTMPVEPVDASGISFTTSVTPTHFAAVAAAFSKQEISASLTSSSNSDAFDDMPPLVDAPPTNSEFILFPPAVGSNGSSQSIRAKAHSKKKPENHIPRPPNAFILFRSSFIKSQHVSTEVETNHSTLSKIIGITWQNLPEEERKVWHDKAKAALEEHRRKYPKYAFRPLHNRGGGGGGVKNPNSNLSPSSSGTPGGLNAEPKRKVREVEPKDLKRCAKIAELLISGKKGVELDAAIQEFDKTHVPEIITRFETPLTARQFRRSSSAPIEGGQESGQNKFLVNEEEQQPAQQQRSKKQRAASTKPTRSSTPLQVQQLQPQPRSQSQQQAIAETTPIVESEPFKNEPPVFDFASFSFENMVSSIGSPTGSDYSCDPLTPTLPAAAPPQLHLDMSIVNQHHHHHHQQQYWSPSTHTHGYPSPSPISPVSEIHTPGLEFGGFDAPDSLYGSCVSPITPHDVEELWHQHQIPQVRQEQGGVVVVDYSQPEITQATGLEASYGFGPQTPDAIDPYHLTINHGLVNMPTLEYQRFDRYIVQADHCAPVMHHHQQHHQQQHQQQQQQQQQQMYDVNLLW